MTSLSPEEERRWIRQLQRGNERAIVRLVRTFEKRVYNHAYRMLGRHDEALDISQEVFLTVVTKVRGFRGDSRLRRWIDRITHNHCLNRIKYLKRRHQERHRVFEEERGAPSRQGFSTQIPQPDQQLEGSRSEAVLNRAIAALDPDQRSVLILRDIHGLTYDEIADTTGLPLGTVKSKLHRARQEVALVYRRWREGVAE